MHSTLKCDSEAINREVAQRNVVFGTQLSALQSAAQVNSPSGVGNIAPFR